ncbi:hypothetical protein Daura_20770 [Dactylosporangium aurantiacum]|uniref:Uncharacterized protein n=1 Tax=Dactylosporangium aurantiacum TaxID=35754 RepID=A0A9Q9INS0_9ACTN|nr:hypothetical protein [Dactylosporangium aurantiacum]MDG6109997.1 hypothetical protein [Dactylosporangium aurantiacum]UWZ58398.1 hypothetical protein Daura_20770 [Dactylosporangium aurantiacum]
MAPLVPVPPRTARSLLANGARTLHVDGNLKSSREWFDQAYRRAERDVDDEAQAVAAVGYGGLWVHEHRGAGTAVLIEARLRRALALVEPASPLGVRVQARLAAELDYREGGHERVFAAVEQARRSGDAVALAEALSLAHHCVLGPHQAQLREAVVRELIETGLRSTRRGDTLIGLLWHTVDRFLAGDRHAERSLQELRTLLRRKPHEAIGYVVQAMEVMLTIRAGDLELAERRAASCAEAGKDAGDADVIGWQGAHTIALHWYRGTLPELIPVLRELVNSPTLSAVDNSHLAALAVAAAAAGDQRLARGCLARLEGPSWSALPMTSSWLATMYGVVEAAHRLGDRRVAAAVHDLLHPFHRLPIMASIGVTCFGSAAHALGVASLTVGDVDRAVTQFEDAVHANQSLQHWPAAMLSRVRLAEALWYRNGGGDHAAAQRHLAQARAEATALGLPLPAVAAGERAAVHGAVATLRCTRRGLHWELRLGDRAVLVEGGKGMAYLASLTANPGFEIPAAELAAGPGTAARAAGADRLASAQHVLDDEAKRAYRVRLTELESAIDEFETMNDLGKAEQARAERSWLIEELAAATGLGGRSRRFADGAERARISVGKAIRRAIAQVEAADPVIGKHLRCSVRTGMRCCYRPR